MQAEFLCHMIMQADFKSMYSKRYFKWYCYKFKYKAMYHKFLFVVIFFLQSKVMIYLKCNTKTNLR